MMVGMSAGLVQGAQGMTHDIDLWFERNDDPRIAAAARSAGGFWMSGFGMRPAGVAGDGLEDLDVVSHMHGLRSFDEEYARSLEFLIDELPVRVLPLERIICSKRATNRAKDQAQIPALEDALAVRDDAAGDAQP